MLAEVWMALYNCERAPFFSLDEKVIFSSHVKHNSISTMIFMKYMIGFFETVETKCYKLAYNN